MNKHASGMRGQHEAEAYLKDNGYRILERNYRTRTDEIDLIASQISDAGEYIVFVEVKFRAGTRFGLPREAVGFAKQQRIIRAALQYIADNNLHDCDCRFDVVEVLGQGAQVHINHIENAFGA